MPDTSADLRSQLLAREASLSVEVQRHREQLGEPAAATTNTFIAGAEGAMADADDLREVSLLQRAQRELDEVRAALQRLADGSYGECVSCGAAIGLPRLRAVPEARLCVACQSAAEQRPR